MHPAPRSMTSPTRSDFATIAIPNAEGVRGLHISIQTATVEIAGWHVPKWQRWPIRDLARQPRSGVSRSRPPSRPRAAWRRLGRVQPCRGDRRGASEPARSVHPPRPADLLTVTASGGQRYVDPGPRPSPLPPRTRRSQPRSSTPKFEKYEDSSAVTDLRDILGRGHSLTIESGWRRGRDRGDLRQAARGALTNPSGAPQLPSRRQVGLPKAEAGLSWSSLLLSRCSERPPMGPTLRASRRTSASAPRWRTLRERDSGVSAERPRDCRMPHRSMRSGVAHPSSMSSKRPPS
jgi:hypothetical protein